MTESLAGSIPTGAIHESMTESDSAFQVPRIAVVGSWQNLVLVIFLAWVVFNLYTLYSTLQQMPSPLYGGDVYYHFGVINHIYSGNFPWTNSHFLGEYAHYPWISHFLTAMLAKLFRIDTLTAATYFPILTALGAALVAFGLGKEVFKDKTMALFFAMYYSTFQVPFSAASPFSEMVVFPLFVWLLFRAKSLRGRLLAGLGLGLTGLSQVIAWVGAHMLIIFLALWRLASIHVAFEPLRLTRLEGIVRSIKEQIQWFLPVILIGYPIAMLFWFPPLFIYGGVTPNNWSEYVATGPALTIGVVLDALKIWFFNPADWRTFLLSFGALIGLAFALWRPKRFLIPFLVSIIPIIGLLHPLIKEVGIGYYAFGYIYTLARGLLVFTGVFVVYKNLSNRPRMVWSMLIALFLVYNASVSFAWYDNDRWVQAGRQPNVMLNLATQIKETTPLDAVFLTSHEETGFALNAMTGRKVVVARRTHASPFVDVNRRTADAAIMLYGKNSSLTESLIKQYHVKYIYEDYYSIQNQQDCRAVFSHLDNPANHDASMACLRTDPRKAGYLQAAGIEIAKVNARLDPASNVAPTFDMLAIHGAKVNPWLEDHKKLIAEIKTGEQIFQRLYEIQWQPQKQP